MDNFITITLLPVPEIAAPTAMNQLFTALHHVLVRQERDDIGVSFPEHKKTLGHQLRLHGSHRALTSLMSEPWLNRFNDYCHVSAIQAVPDNTRFCHVKRVQAKSAHNKRQRSIAKGWLSAEDADTRIPPTQQKRLKFPFVQLVSTSTKQVMRIYIQHSPPTDTALPGTFNRYGLSSTATVPWF